MSNVSMAEVMAKNWLPKRASLCAPTPAAPTVCEMVLSDNMAAMGLSMSCLYFLSRGAPLRPSFSSMDTNDIGAESSTASRIEHKMRCLKHQRDRGVIAPWNVELVRHVPCPTYFFDVCGCLCRFGNGRLSQGAAGG